MLKNGLAFSAFSLGLLLAGAVQAQAEQLVPFDEFFKQASSAKSSAFVGTTGGVTNAAAFSQMQQHVVSLYTGVSVKHSFLLDSHAWDCVPVAQQPSARAEKITTIPTPPTLPSTGPAPKSSALAATQLAPGQTTDSLGHSLTCENGTIPMRRVTLEDLARFKTLSDFFSKGPNGAGQAPAAQKPVAATHKYAHSYQFVSNVGGRAVFNLWNQNVNTSLNEIFSLEQHWYVNTSKTLQTLETGLQNYPQKYNTHNTVLFIYWTADAYKSIGCYNLDCSGFVQTNKNIYLGRGFTNYSTQGGSQYAVDIEAYHTGGRWWIYLGGGAASNAIGYYPDSVYHGGTMTVGANEIDYGGETVGTTIWPPMGGGQFPSAGFGHAAYVRTIQYFANASAFVANLTASQPSPSCYKDALTNKSSSSWGTYFYFGGPGGKNC